MARSPHTTNSYPKVPDIAAKFGVHPRTVWDWVYRGILPHYKLGRSIYFKWEDIDEALNQNRFLGYRRVPASAVIQTPAGPIPKQIEMDYGDDNFAPVRLKVETL